jgi:hypothetical protein
MVKKIIKLLESGISFCVLTIAFYGVKVIKSLKETFLFPD